MASGSPSVNWPLTGHGVRRGSLGAKCLSDVFTELCGKGPYFIKQVICAAISSTQLYIIYIMRIL